MLYYDLIWRYIYIYRIYKIYKIEVPEGIDVYTIRASKVHDICYNWYFIDKDLKFQLGVCKGCHGVLMIPVNLNNIAILNISGVDFCIVNEIAKSEAVNLLQNADFTEERTIIKINKFRKIITISKMDKKIMFGNFGIEKQKILQPEKKFQYMMWTLI